VTGPEGAFAYGFVANGGNLPAGVTGPEHTVSYEYQNGRNTLASVDNRINGAGTPVSNYAYSYNVLGQRTGVDHTGSAFGAATGFAWHYNAAGEVIAANHATDQSLNRAYSYDGIGNRFWSSAGNDALTQTSAEAPPSTGLVTAYDPDALNQYDGIAPPSGPALVPGYDDDGNQTADGGDWTYVWNAENRLVQAANATSGQTIDYAYDYMGRRVRKTVGTGSGVTSDEVFLYDGWNLTAVYSLNTSTLTLRTSYTWGRDLSGRLQGAGGVGGLLSSKDYQQSGASYHYTYDGNGNVSEVLDAFDSVAAHYEYDAFGGTTAATGTYAAENQFRFSTKFLDEESGLYYYGYRYYSPETGRWVSRDPLEELGGFNLSAFVSNDPVIGYDYLGLACKVTFNCTLIPPETGSAKRPTISSLFTNCDYSCTETKREQAGGLTGTVLCSDLPDNLQTTSSSQVFCGSCPTTATEVKLFDSADFKLDCSRKDCRSGCDLAAAAGMRSGNGAIKAAAIAARTACYDSCNSICRNP
jgi:RHS repeat-associated protein